MPPRRAADDDSLIALRFKLGIYTICELVDTTTPFSDITAELLNALRERYPDGLRSPGGGRTISVPKAGDEVQVVYGILKAPTDPSQGWKPFKVTDKDTPASKGLRKAAVLAFKILGPDEGAEEVKFEVDFPQAEE
ncbi:hypothetical protein P8C59_005982 [Phyllachora maydis]|uniref:Uncharacterized protein n=1 Tax=Phyllachora maydis TaxID=1825666 RepID=A0AAD9I6R8_9PEZI|nr:hypothetical protein P8C59_005982 [Phyllachora maydis]